MAADAKLQCYVDADILGVAKVLTTVRSDVTYPGDAGGVCPDKRLRPACAIVPSTKDHVWIPVVTEAGWIVITKDSAIGRSPRLRALVMEHGARLVAVASRARYMNTWEHLEIVVNQWPRIEALVGVPGRWIYRATRSTFTKSA